MTSPSLPPGLDPAVVAELATGVKRLEALMPLLEKRFDDFSLAYAAAGREAARIIKCFGKIVTAMTPAPKETPE